MFDVLGRVVWHRDLGPLTAGSHSIAVDVQGFPAGIYFIRLSDGNQVAQRRLIHVR